MRTRALLPLAALTALALGAVPAAAKPFKYGVTAGDVTKSSAMVWTRADKPGNVTLQVSADKRFGNGDDIARSLKAKKGHDNTVTVKVGHLRAGHRYVYRFTQGNRKSLTGRFVTAPKPSAGRTIKFAFTGDADAQKAPGQSKPFYDNFEVYGQMAKEKNDFNVNLGDTIYSDTTVGGDVNGGAFHPHFPVARTVKEKWGKYRLNLGLKNLQKVRARVGMYNQWDDHEFIDDFSRPRDGETLYKAGVHAFRDYMPAKYSSKRGLYRSFRWGKNLEVFLPDEISFRSAKAGDSGVCNNPQTGEPDVAPTLPQSKRDLFSALYPPLKYHIPQACLDKIKDPTRTILGASQLARFEKAVKKSKAKWKVVLNEDPITQVYLFPYDQWEGYAAERLSLLNYLKANVKNVAFLTTDAHWTYYADARLRTLEPGGPIESGVKELVTGPVAVLNWGKTINALTGNPNTANTVASLFYRPPPPNGDGLQCGSLFTNAYAEVKVTSKTLTMTPKDGAGNPVRETTKDGDTGPVCGPYTLTAK